jgi:hypothetical protein
MIAAATPKKSAMWEIKKDGGAESVEGPHLQITKNSAPSEGVIVK